MLLFLPHYAIQLFLQILPTILTNLTIISKGFWIIFTKLIVLQHENNLQEHLCWCKNFLTKKSPLLCYR